MVRFECEGSFEEALEVLGQTPLPPYIKRHNESSEDRQRYQTVYASARGAIAAPTAGLHFTRQAMDKLEASGLGIAELTLHVGYGTFEPVRVRNVIDHRVAPERYEIGDSSAKAINQTHARGNRVVAIGTTTTRALESATEENGRVVAGAGEARLTITPGYKFRVVDSLLTNFHLPRSSLLILIAAFAGRDLVLEAYKHAVAERYRFYSYGDCMLII
jgi:S-adenosylmethionine:tRNA ribosyltransferase-isomerase